jgi:hypothetical protein
MITSTKFSCRCPNEEWEDMVFDEDIFPRTPHGNSLLDCVSGGGTGISETKENFY